MESTQKIATLTESGIEETGPSIVDGEFEEIQAPSAQSDRRSVRVPPPPSSLEDAGLSGEFVSGLLLKALYVRGSALGFELVDLLALPMAILDDVIRELQDRRFVEVHETRGPSRGEYAFRLTSEGRARAAEEMEVSRYVGPAPVPFEDFCDWVERQTMENVQVLEDELRASMEGAVVTDRMFEMLGPAINSGRSLFLYGSPGNGKTLLAERIARLFGDSYYVPYAVLIDGHVMIVHDPVHHRDEDEGESKISSTPPTDIVRLVPEHDRRFAEARRPVVITGGELTLDQLDLRWDSSGRMYQAPPQLKAAGGVLVVDDLGRQRVDVQDLLNRWVVPLEQRRDYLTLKSGRKIVVPFDCFVIFSTNLQPRELADEAFLRRIHYKIEVPGPCRDEYERIFRGCCEAREIPFDEAAVSYLYDEFYADGTNEPRRCHPRDVLDHVKDLAAYRGAELELTPELIEQACQSYFVSSDEDGRSEGAVFASSARTRKEV